MKKCVQGFLCVVGVSAVATSMALFAGCGDLEPDKATASENPSAIAPTTLEDPYGVGVANSGPSCPVTEHPNPNGLPYVIAQPFEINAMPMDAQSGTTGPSIKVLVQAGSLIIPPGQWKSGDAAKAPTVAPTSVGKPNKMLVVQTEGIVYTGD